MVRTGAVRNVTNARDPLSSISIAQIEYDMAVNCTSAIVAAQQAVLGFKDLPASASKTFIYTGNKLHLMTLEHVPLFGIGKSAASYLIHTASKAYRDAGFKLVQHHSLNISVLIIDSFYYTNERLLDGSQAGPGFDGEGRSKLHVELAENREQGPWDYSFVKGIGYVDFGAVVED